MMRGAVIAASVVSRPHRIPSGVMAHLASSSAPVRARWSSTNQSSKTPKPKSSNIQHGDDWRTAPIVEYGEVKQRSMSPPEGSYLIDVREPDEIAQGMIPTAHSIPLSTFVDSIRLPPQAFYDKHNFVKPGEDQDIIFYCRSGRRSATACDSAIRNGYTNVKNYSGSWLDWVKKTQENEYNFEKKD